MVRRIYTSATTANADIASAKRYQGLIVPVDIGGGASGGLQLYWYKSGITDADLVPLLGTSNSKTISSNYTALPSDDTLFVNTTNGNISIDLTGVNIARKRITIKRIINNSNTITLTTSSGTMDGLSTVLLNSNFESATYQSDGTNLYKVSEVTIMYSESTYV